MTARRASLAARLFLCLFALFAWHAPDGWSANANRYIALAHSILLEGRFEIDTWHEATIDTAWTGEHWYAGAAPGPALLALPAVAVARATTAALPAPFVERVERAARRRLEARAGQAPELPDLGRFAIAVQVVTLLVPPAAGAFAGVLFFAWLRRRMSERDALILTLLAFLGTMAFHYSTVLFAHVPVIVAILASWRLIEQDRPLAAGAMAASVIALDYLAAPVSAALLALAFLAWREGRKRWRFLAGGAAIGALLAAYHWAAFGGPLTTPYAFPATPAGAGSHTPLMGGFFGMYWPQTSVVVEILIGLERGLLLHAPIVGLGLVGLLLALRRPTPELARGPAAIALAGAAAVVLFNGSMHAPYLWRGGTGFGPRYLMPAIPLLWLGLAPLWARGQRWRHAIVGIGAVSVSINWLGAMFGPSDTRTDFPLAQRFLTELFTHGPRGGPAVTLGAVFNWPAGAVIAVYAGGLIAIGLAVRSLLRSAES